MVSDKDDLRQRLLAARRGHSPQQRDLVTDAICDHALAHLPIARATAVAVYLSMPTEPGTSRLVAALLARGTTVWAPVIAPDHALNWVHLDAGTATAPSPLGMQQPVGAGQGPLAALGVDLVIVPALAVDHQGHRLGRGGGYYDRALAGVEAPRYAVVFAEELLPAIPHEPHDEPVDAAISEQGITRFGGFDGPQRS